MSFTKHPRLLARVAGVFYLIIITCALFAYLYVRGHVINPGNMAQTGTNLLGMSGFIDWASRLPSSSLSAICLWGGSYLSC